MDQPETWWLKKHDEPDVLYGPANVDNLRDWALAARISPLDRVSQDNQKTWDRAPMIPDLHMDWLVEVSEDFLYGPTTIGTVQEFLANGEIDDTTTVINCKENTRCAIGDNPVFKNAPRKAPVMLRQVSIDMPMPTIDSQPSGNVPIEMQKRVLELEALILQQRRSLEECRRRYQSLKEKYTKETGKNP